MHKFICFLLFLLTSLSPSDNGVYILILTSCLFQFSLYLIKKYRYFFKDNSEECNEILLSTEVICQVQVKKQDKKLRRPLAEVDRGQCDKHLRNSLHRHNLSRLCGIRLVPRVALECKFGKVGGKARPGHFATRCLFHSCRPLFRRSPSLFQSRPQV